jgi:hypothetical protein
MPLYRPFDEILAEQTEENYKTWLLELQQEWKKAFPHELSPLKICADTARNAYDSGMTPYQCLSEKHYD